MSFYKITSQAELCTLFLRSTPADILSVLVVRANHAELESVAGRAVG